ncbi:MAG: tetratricopeptide (TPR) repeat protein [Bradymonadia bacterium]
MGAGAGAGTLVASAGEAAEFGLINTEKAQELYTESTAHDDADARAFAGLRRLARDENDADGVLDAYRKEAKVATSPTQAVTAGVGLAQVMIRLGRRADLAERVLRDLEPLIAHVDHEIIAVYRATLEDVLVVAGRPSQALQLRVQRWGELRGLGEGADEWAVDAALAIVAASEAIGSRDEAILEWYEVIFELSRSAEALRPLLRACYERGDFSSAEALISEAVGAEDDVDIRTRYQYELGLIRGRRLNDRPGGLSALTAGIKGADVSPLVAASFLSQARAQQGAVVTDDFVDALGTGLDFAANGVERADYLTRLAVRVSADLGMSEEAIGYAQDALIEAPGYLPAIRLLGTLYAREGRWAELATLGESQFTTDLSSGDRVRLHERQADLYLNELGDAVSAERHLRSALDHECYLPVVRRLARLLAGQFRWEDLFDHFRESAARVRLGREKVFLLERAGDVAEIRLRDAGLAIEVFRELLDVSPGHGTAISSLGRLLSQQQRWEELLELNETELELTPNERRVRVAILCRSAEIARRHLGEIVLTENFYRRALDEEPTCSEALQGFGQILTAQERWDELVEMTEREMAHIGTDIQRRRCLHLLGELHATRTGDSAAAVRCYEELAAGKGVDREVALVWLDRLFQATENPHERLRVLALRHDEAPDPGSRAKLAFRMAELLEWSLDHPGESFEFYIEALSDRISGPVCLNALDRVWADTEITDDERSIALRCVRELSERVKGPLRRQALLFIVERGEAIVESDLVDDAWTCLVAEWPEDVRASERCAIIALQAGDVRLAEAVRAAAPAGPVEVARTHWSAVDEGIVRHDLPELDADLTPEMCATLNREDGSVDLHFVGVEARDIFQRMAAGHVTLGELKHTDGTETGTRLAALAARALADTETLRDRWIALAEETVEPNRKMQAWLDLVDEDGFEDSERREWLRNAANVQSFNPVLRDALYDRMTRVSDFEGLEQAIVDHLTQARPEAEEAAQLALRRARCLEVQRRRPEAIEALEYSTLHAPADAAIALEKARLETLEDQMDTARLTLEACLDAGADGLGRVELLGRLADLHQMNGGNKQRALTCLEDAYALSENAKEWGVRLASAHASFGHAERCVDLLETHLEEPPNGDDVRNWQLLARVYGTRLDSQEEAERILWMLFSCFPERRATLGGLEDFYRRNNGAVRFADQLGMLLAESRLDIPQAHAARLWKYIGELNFAVIGRMSEAEQAFAKARSLGDTSADAILRHAKSVAKQPGRVRDAVPLLVDALDTGAGEARLWEDAFTQLEDLFREMQMHGRLRVARQVRATLGANVKPLDEHVRRDPSRELPGSAAWSLIGAGLYSQEEAAVLSATAPLAERVMSRYAPSKKSLGGRKFRREEFAAFDTFLDTACRWLDVQRPKVTVGDQGRGVRAFDLQNVWVPEERIGDSTPLAARFWAGWTAAMLFSEMVPYTWSDGRVVDEFFQGLADRANLPGGISGQFDEELSGLMVMSQRRAATSALQDHPEFMGVRKDWTVSAMKFADRAGLLMCGDLRTAVEEVLVASGWDRRVENPRTREFIVSDARLRSMVLYAIGDEHFLARYESGLAERPFLFA